MYKKHLLFVILLVNFFLLAGAKHCCSWQPSRTALVSQNIISLAPNITEIVCYLGGQNRLSGITNDCNFPPSIKNKTKVGKYTFPDLEKIIALQPAIVLAESSADPRFLQRLHSYNIDYRLYNFKRLSSFFKELKKINKDLGLAGESKINNLANIYSKKQLTRQNKKILILVWQNPYIVPGSDTFLSDYFQNIGYENIIKRKGYPQISYEYLLGLNPDLLINLSNKKINLPAKTNTKIINNLDADILMRLTPRLIEYYEKISF